MPTLDDIAGVDSIDTHPGAIDALPRSQDENDVTSTAPDFAPLVDLFKRPTGEGSIDDYLDHPLNFRQSKGLAQIIRGVTGLIGDGLGVWWVDVVFGTFRMRTEGVQHD